MTKKTSCPNFKECSFLKKYYPEKSCLYYGWVKSFCEDIKKSADCKRKQYFDEYDTMAPEDMTPTGELWIDQ